MHVDDYHVKGEGASVAADSKSTSFWNQQGEKSWSECTFRWGQPEVLHNREVEEQASIENRMKRNNKLENVWFR